MRSRKNSLLLLLFLHLSYIYWPELAECRSATQGSQREDSSDIQCIIGSTDTNGYTEEACLEYKKNYQMIQRETSSDIKQTEKDVNDYLENVKERREHYKDTKLSFKLRMFHGTTKETLPSSRALAVLSPKSLALYSDDSSHGRSIDHQDASSPETEYSESSHGTIDDQDAPSPEAENFHLSSIMRFCYEYSYTAIPTIVAIAFVYSTKKFHAPEKNDGIDEADVEQKDEDMQQQEEEQEEKTQSQPSKVAELPLAGKPSQQPPAGTVHQSEEKISPPLPAAAAAAAAAVPRAVSGQVAPERPHTAADPRAVSGQVAPQRPHSAAERRAVSGQVAPQHPHSAAEPRAVSGQVAPQRLPAAADPRAVSGQTTQPRQPAAVPKTADKKVYQAQFAADMQTAEKISLLSSAATVQQPVEKVSQPVSQANLQSAQKEQLRPTVADPHSTENVFKPPPAPATRLQSSEKEYQSQSTKALQSEIGFLHPPPPVINTVLPLKENETSLPPPLASGTPKPERALTPDEQKSSLLLSESLGTPSSIGSSLAAWQREKSSLEDVSQSSLSAVTNNDTGVDNDDAVMDNDNVMDNNSLDVGVDENDTGVASADTAGSASDSSDVTIVATINTTAGSNDNDKTPVAAGGLNVKSRVDYAGRDESISNPTLPGDDLERNINITSDGSGTESNSDSVDVYEHPYYYGNQTEDMDATGDEDIAHHLEKVEHSLLGKPAKRYKDNLKRKKKNRGRRGE